MPQSPGPNAPVTPQELTALLRLAGLDVSDQRAPLVLDELNVQVRHVQAIDAVLEGAELPAATPYDPTFPNVIVEAENA